MEICEICGFSAKNKNGLRLHMVKHKNDNIPIKPVRVELFDMATDKLIISYPVQGKEAIEQAKKHAEKNKFKIVLKVDNK